MHWYKILAFCVAFLAGTYAQRVELTSSAREARDGDVVTFTCLVYSFQPGHFLRWTKTVDDVAKPINIATNYFLEQAFVGTEFEALSPAAGDPVEFKLKINGVSYKHQGKYGCSIPTTGSDTVIESSVDLIVLRDISTFEFIFINGTTNKDIRDRTEFKFRNEEQLNIKCEATKAYPKPEVSITIGGKPVDERHVTVEVDSHYDVLDDKMGNTEQWVSVTKSFQKRIEYQDADKTIACTAKLPDAPETEAMQRSMVIRMEGMPPILHCASEWTAWEDSDDQVILCNVTSKPPIRDAIVTYYRSGQHSEAFLERINVGIKDRYTLEIGPGGSYVALLFRKVFMQDFREYNISVENDVGSADKVVKFVRAESRGQYSVNVELSKSKANVGDDLEVTCSVSSEVSKPDGSENNYPIIVWVKRVDNQEVEIGTNGYLNDDFKKTGRYFADADYEYDDAKDLDLSKITLMLSIKGVQPQDSGQIGCRIPEQKIEVFRPFNVFVNVKSILLNSADVDGTHAQSYNDGAEVTFDEGHVRKFYCHINGSFPTPAVSIHVGDRNITSQFERVDKVLTKGLVRGLKESTYAVTMKNEAFTIDYSFNKKRLECRASVPTSDFETVSTGIQIKLAGYKPKFVCNKTIVVHFLQEDVHIRCLVHADPTINHFRIYWSPLAQAAVGNVSLEGNSSEGHYHADIEDGPSESEKTMVLKIDRIFQQHFRKYYFEAGNTLGKETFEINLERDESYVNEKVDNDDGNDESEETGAGQDQAYVVTGGASFTLSSMATLLVSFILWKVGIEC